MRPTQIVDRFFWDVNLVPTYVLYRMQRRWLPDEHPWKKSVISFEAWTEYATEFNYFLGMVLSLSMYGLIATLLVIWCRS